MSWDPDDEVEQQPEVGTDSLPRDLTHGLALGYLASAPLLVAYEWSLASGGGISRSTAELCLFRALAPLGDQAHLARQAILAVLFLGAFIHAARRHWGMGPSLARVAVEGLVGALVLGPLLLALTHLLGGLEPPVGFTSVPSSAPELARAAFVFGAAAHEELFFRVILYSGLFLVVRSTLGFLGAGAGLARITGEGAGLIGSALIFAALHLESFTSWLGPGGEVFDSFVFLWRLVAGVLLGLLLRWRGPGVAAWTHGLFNVALLLGAGPEVGF